MITKNEKTWTTYKFEMEINEEIIILLKDIKTKINYVCAIKTCRLIFPHISFIAAKNLIDSL